MGIFDSIIQQQIQAGTRAPQNLDAKLILSTAPQQWRVMVNDIATLVQNKYEKLISKGAVYTGRMVDGQWRPESLYDVYPQFGRIYETEAALTLGEDGKLPLEIDGLQFMGGSKNRVFYADMNELAKHAVNEWFQAKGDPHFLASMFTRPGKTARKNVRVNLPHKRLTGGEADGTLFRLALNDWLALCDAFQLPAGTKLAQVTLFDPDAMAGKGTIRCCLPHEEPTTYTESFKWLAGDSFMTQSLSILTTDSVYTPNASVNTQEITYAQFHGAKFASWLKEEIDWNVHQIVTGMRESPTMVSGYLNTLGLPTPDTLIADVTLAQKNALVNLLRSFKVRKNRGWRGKIAASETVQEASVLLPNSITQYINGEEVYIGRNPALPKNGYLKYRVQGYHSGNYIVLNDKDERWSNVLGGDWDGDDAVVLFYAPFEGISYEYELKLQEYKSTARSMAASTPAERRARWEKEQNAPIGQFDLLARYAIDMGIADDELLYDITKAIQFAISLRKRDGNIKDYETPRMIQARKDIGHAKEATETYYLREFANMHPLIRATFRHNVTSELNLLLTSVEQGIEAVELERPRFTIRAIESILGTLAAEFDPGEAITAKVEEFLSLWCRLIDRKKNAQDDDESTNVNRMLRMLTQVVMPRYALSLEHDDWVHFCAELYRVKPQDRDFWLWSVHPAVLLLGLKNTYAGEKQQLIAKNGHSLQEGDVVLVPPQTRKFVHDGTEFTLHSGILLLDEPTKFVVTKVYAKSVTVEPLNEDED